MKTRQFGVKWRQAGVWTRMCERTDKKGKRSRHWGGGVGVMLGMWLKNKSKKKTIWICVRTYQSAHTMTSKWPSKAEMSSSQSHLSTLWHKEDRVSVSSGCCHAGPRFELRAHSWRPLPLHLRGKKYQKRRMWASDTTLDIYTSWAQRGKAHFHSVFMEEFPE